MDMKKFGLFLFAFLVCLFMKGQTSQKEFNYKIEVGGYYAPDDFVPYYMVSNRNGIISPESSVGYLRGGIEYKLGTSSDLKLDMGVDIVGYTAVSNPYYDVIHLQQLYVNASYKKVGMSLGMFEGVPMLVDKDLSSGNMIWSENSRPMPQVKLGTTEFVSVPGTQGWLNFCFDMSYGVQLDGDYNKEQFERYKGSGDLSNHPSHLIENTLIHRKNFFIRSHADKPVVVTAGIEHVVQFGGRVDGVKMDVSAKDYVKSFFASKGAQTNLYNHIASADLRIDLKLSERSVISAYAQLFFDDLSLEWPIRQNGFDGLWGVEWLLNKDGKKTHLLLEYLQTSNQGGPVYAFEDYKYGDLDRRYSSCTYYNDQHYGSWANYGMANGTPMLKSPLYNKDCYPEFTSTLVCGYHVGVSGDLSGNLSYKVLGSYRKTWGSPMALLPHTQENVSALLAVSYHKNGWDFSPSVSFDKGKIYGDNFGLGFVLCKRGVFLNKK